MKRSGFFQQIAVGAFSAAVFPKHAFSAVSGSDSSQELLYIGSYTETSQQGISVCRFDHASGNVQLADVCSKVKNPSFLIFDPTRKFLYAVNETDDFRGKKSGSVSAFRRDEKTGKLSFLNEMPSLGAHPCHLSVDRTGKFILVANYTGGNVSVLPILADGSLGEPADMVQHTGKGPNKARQETAHAHSVNLSPDNRFAFVCDLGIDKIMIYLFYQETGKLTPADHPFFQTAPGAGPRHFTFSKDGSRAFVVNELNSTLTCMTYEKAIGRLTEMQTVTTLPDGFSGENTCADLHLHPNGMFIYASNRGHDSIAVFSIEQGSGKLKLLQNQSVKGKTPRNFAIHHSGRLLLAANQNSESITTFFLDPATGKLSDTGKSITINKPVCILF